LDKKGHFCFGLTAFLFCVLTAIPFTSHALEVIRVNVDQNATSQSVDIELFDNIVSNTVNNFLSYMDDGSYNHLFINRSVKGFVVQAGGYTYDPALGGFSFHLPGNLMAVFNRLLQNQRLPMRLNCPIYVAHLPWPNYPDSRIARPVNGL